MMRTLAVAAFAGLLLLGAGDPAGAQSAESGAKISDGVVKIGLILDLSGPYSDTGIGSAAAAKLAVDDYGGKVLGAPIEVVIADHEQSTDRAATIAREWFDHQNLDAVMDVSGSSEALIVQRIADTRHKIISLSSPGAARLSNEACTPTSVQYVFNTRSVAETVGAALVARGDKTWFFITVDYSFGYDLENDVSAVVSGRGGQVLGHARHPLDVQDFTSYLARAKESKAKVIGLANAGADLSATIRQAAQMGMIPGSQTFAALNLRINGVHAIGLEMTQGMVLSESFYWDLDDQTRAFGKRFFERTRKMPNSAQAGVYSSTLHYLKAVARAGTDDTDAVMKEMRAAPIDDLFARFGRIRPDGLMVHDTRMFQVKAPSASRYPWDYYELVATIPGDTAFGPLAQSKCPLAKQ
jgi:branched-chain amino acid transport system substrate-binding protein